MFTINELKNNFPNPGVIQWIGLRPSSSKSVLHVKTAELLSNHGMVGDKAAEKPGGKRQVTLIQAEYFPVMEAMMNNRKISPEELRRNIVISGINLSALRGQALKINDAIIEITGNCVPCTKMEKALGFGAYNAIRNHGGVNAIVKKSGRINIGDEVRVSFDSAEDDSPQANLL